MSLKSISPSGREFLINTYIGKEIYNSVHPATRNVLLIDALKLHKIRMIEKYGSEWEYRKVWCKQNGFETPNDYRKFLADINGFDSYWKMYVAHSGKSVKEILETQARKRGFNNIREYQEFRAKENGFKNFREYKNEVRKVKETENINSGLCRCGRERENKSFAQCEKCRVNKRRRNRKRAEKLREKGLCIRCGKEKEKEHIYCNSCLKEKRKDTRKYRKESES